MRNDEKEKKSDEVKKSEKDRDKKTGQKQLKSHCNYSTKVTKWHKPRERGRG